MKKQVKLNKVINKLDSDFVKLLKEQLVKDGVDLDDCEVFRKNTEAVTDDIEHKAKLEEGTRTAIKYISTRTVDQSGDIILPKGVDFKLFKKGGMPVFHNHDYSKPQIGIAESIKADEWGVMAKVRYADTGEGTLADVLWKLTSQGMNKQSSVGIIPTEIIRKGDDSFNSAVKILVAEYPELKKTKGDLNRIISKCILFEFSDVSLACNTDTDVLAVSKMYSDAGADAVLLKQLGLDVKMEEKDEVLDVLVDGDENRDAEVIDVVVEDNDVSVEEDIVAVKEGEEPPEEVKRIPDSAFELEEKAEEVVIVEKKVEKVTLVAEPTTVKLIHKPQFSISKDDIKKELSAEMRKKLGRLL